MSKKITRTDQSEVKALCGPKDLPDTQGEQEFPGVYPYRRGIQPTMYRGRLWTMRQYAGFGSARESNQRYRQLLDQGQTGLSVAFDLPTQMGYDPDDPMSHGEVGKVGVSIASIEDMRCLFDSIPLDQVSTSMTINASASILLCFYIAVAQEQGVDPSLLRGTLQNDILKEYIARGTYIFPPPGSMRLLTDLIEYCSHNLPRFNPISISGYHIREAGSDAIQELAFTFCNAIAYVESALQRGLDVDQFAPRLSFFFAAHNDLLQEVSKFRAARVIWANIMQDRFGAKQNKSKMLRFHVQTGGSTLTAQQPDINIVRTTIQAMASVLGGCQSLHTNSKDEALSLPSQESALTALRTQQIIAQESGIANTIDPFAGSYAIEHETQRIIEEVESIIGRVDEMGGSVKAIEKSYFQNAIADRAYEYQKDIDTKKRKIVGVNVHQSEENASVPLFEMDPQVESDQIQRLQSFRSSRDAGASKNALKKLRAAAESPGENMIPYILDAVSKHATLGEISNELRAVFGQYQAS